MFKDRKNAGRKLAKALEKYKDKKPLILAIPKGGVPVACQVAKNLNVNSSDFSLLISRKLPYPDNPEAGFGAIVEDGSVFIFPDTEKFLSKEKINEIMKEQTIEIKRRLKKLRQGKALPKISGRIVILIDDGLAMGSTMIASIMFCKKRKAKRIIVAVPVSGRGVAKQIEKMVDEIIVLEKPEFFQAVAQAYENWYDLSDKQVLDIMENWRKFKSKTE